MQFIKQIAHTVTVFHQGRVLVEDTMENIQGNELVREIYLGKADDD
jgi:branched-chain amino acid transport system ATP-binding protein/urea transport system ATP-binding protein